MTCQKASLEGQVFSIEKRYIDDMLSHALLESPNECCGILAGSDGRIEKLYRCTNAEKSPYRYNLEPKELLQIWREVEEKRWQFLGLYHSHTFSEAYPSPTDIRLAFWSDSLYFIVSLADQENPIVRAFRIAGGDVIEEPLEIKP